MNAPLKLSSGEVFRGNPVVDWPPSAVTIGVYRLESLKWKVPLREILSFIWANVMLIALLPIGNEPFTAKAELFYFGLELRGLPDI